MHALLRAFLAAIGPRDTAAQKGSRLLRANLTPAQLVQYDRCRYFDVKGGESGRRFRIHPGDAMNVDEYDETGICVSRWCFQPAGSLVPGDLLLAQKLALELFESEARAIANKYPTHWPLACRSR